MGAVHPPSPGRDAKTHLQSGQSDLLPVKRLFAIALTAATAFGAVTGAIACEKHLNGHQNSSDSNTEGARK